MFKLHDKTRRRLTLTIFILLGPALLFVVLTDVFSRHSAKTVSQWEGLLTNALGKRVEIDSVSFPAPGMVRFTQMRIFASDADEVLLHIPQWELIECFGEMPQHIDPAAMMQSGDQANPPSQKPPSKKSLPSAGFYEPGFPRPSYKRGLFASAGFACSNLFGKQTRYRQCEIPEVSCSSQAIPQAKDVLLEIMAMFPVAQANKSQSMTRLLPTVLFVGEMNITPQGDTTGTAATSATDAVTIKNACFELRPAAEQTTFLATFYRASSEAKPFQLVVFRDRGASASTNVRLTTGENEVPTRLLTELDPFFEGFGAQSRFHGTLVAESNINKRKKRTRSFELTDAVFYNVALESLLSKSLSFRLEGEADKLTFDSVKFRSESSDSDTMRLEFAQGTMINAQGMALWPGLRRLTEGTKLRMVPRDARPPETDITFRDGTFKFQIDPHGIRLFPRLDDQSQQCPLLVIDNHCAVHWPNPQHIIRYDELLIALSQPNSQHIPLMTETQYLIATLPITIAPSDASPNETAQLSQQRVRSADLVRESLSEPHPMPQHTVEQFQVYAQVAQPQPQSQLTPEQVSQLSPPPTLPPTPPRETANVSAMAPVPSLAPPIEPYQQQAISVAMADNRIRQGEPASAVHRQVQEDTYIPRPQPPDSVFLGKPQSTAGPVTPSVSPILQPTSQPVTSTVAQAQVPQSFDAGRQSIPSNAGPPSYGNPVPTQPNGVPYGGNTQPFVGNTQPFANNTQPFANDTQLVAAQQPQNRVMIPAITGMTNEVQTETAQAHSGTFNSRVPTTFDPYPTQVATAQPPMYYQPPVQSSQPPAGQFGL